MLQRTLVAAIGIPFLLIVFICAPSWATLLLVAALCAVGAHEMMHAAAGERGTRLIPLTVVVAALVSGDIYWTNPSETLVNDFLSGSSVLGMYGVMSGQGNAVRPSFLPALALVFVVGLFLYAILHYGKETAVPFSAVTTAIFSALVFPLMLSCLLRLRLMPYGVILVFLPLVIAFGSDTFAYFAGLTMGRHKLAPLVSPKKTIEGCIGGLAGGIIGIALLKGIAYWAAGVVFLQWWQVAVFGILGSAVSQIGDLSFSVVKREFGVKDYGKLLPGHGGVLDRFDSVTFVAPFAYLLLISGLF